MNLEIILGIIQIILIATTPLVFAGIGLIALMIGLLTLLTLFVDLVMDGYPRFNLQFFSDFPSRRAGSAGFRLGLVHSATESSRATVSDYRCLHEPARAADICLHWRPDAICAARAVCAHRWVSGTAIDGRCGNHQDDEQRQAWVGGIKN